MDTKMLVRIPATGANATCDGVEACLFALTALSDFVPDAEAFVDLVITRKASAIKVGTAKYVILCNAQGGIINDPVLLRIAEDEFWFSIADSGAGLYLQGVNALGTYDVTIREIDAAPLSVAGPHALDTVRSLVGPCVDDIPYFGLIEAEIAGCSTVVTRTGFSSEKNFSRRC